MVHTTIISMVNAAIAGLSDARWNIQQHWGCREEPTGDNSLHAVNVTPTVNIITASGYIKMPIRFQNPTHFCVGYRCLHANGPSGAQMPVYDGHSYLALDGTLDLPAEDIINMMVEDLEDNAQRCHTNQRSILSTKLGLQMYERQLQWKHIRLQQYVEVIRHCAVALFTDNMQSSDDNVNLTWLHEHDNIVNPTAAGSFANRK
jgi:hypothetical protein